MKPDPGWVIAGVMALLLALAFWRQAKVRARSDTLALANQEIATRDAAIHRLETDNRTLSASVHKLEGVVEQLQDENASLRALVMGETVPTAMQAALTTVASATAESITAALTEVLKEHREAAKREHDAQFEKLRALSGDADGRKEPR